MFAHHCPNPDCRRFSQHGPGSHHWALTCPHCGHTAPQHPHAPDSPPPAQVDTGLEREPEREPEGEA